MTKKVSNADEPNWGLFYREHTKDLDQRKSIKVKLPIRQHIRLHALKLFTEKNISETVEKALDKYFEEMKAAEAAGLPPGSVFDSDSAVAAGAAAGAATGAVAGAAPTVAAAGAAVDDEDDA